MTTFNSRSTGQQNDLPTWPGNPNPPTGKPRIYTLSLRPGNDGCLEPYIAGCYPDDYDENEEGPLELRIMDDDSLITLNLDANIDWEFSRTDSRHPNRKNGMTVGVADDKADNYFGLAFLAPDKDGRYRGLTFRARKRGAAKPYFDPYSLNFLVYLRYADGTPMSVPLSLAIDPDIKNPGDIITILSPAP